eukprot:TRINITY_DN7954_c0_g1_i1.p1 TRINITY_DN7954_c0_g1~~TRINITY_DN7954_c0_g1_i1.p1  ORF type:complete len:325 (-),score=55.52 TRINITY_DN7954_c0_g1_i1:8-982(-)
MIQSMDVEVVSYNILSDSLCSPSTYPHCTPAALDTPLRFEKIKQKLTHRIESNRPIIGLQEVSRAFSAQLYTFFENLGYCFVYSSYHAQHTGYMGVALAYPRDLYAMKDLKIHRLTDLCANMPPPGQWDAWQSARECTNVLILAHLQQKSTSKEFSLGVYHMPCYYGSTEKMKAMNIHVILLVQYCQDAAGGRPLVVVGDFNFYPVDSCYPLVLEGRMDGVHLEKPEPWPLVVGNRTNGWFKGMRSAYRERGGEPRLTCLHNGTEEKFGEVLDYIFISGEWGVRAVIDIGIDVEEYKKKGITSLPTLEEPSDHVLIGATLFINN